jgi:hypothetical protein
VAASVDFTIAFDRPDEELVDETTGPDREYLRFTPAA